ncbi:MAG: hypothetical protein V4666_12665 [Bacteroidota bacterium]
MKALLFCIFISVIGLNVASIKQNNKFISEKRVESSISFINDSKDKISIYTGTGFVSLNKGSKTSIGCNVGKEVRWANEGKKGDVIFKITSEMCGKTLKLSEFVK